MDLFVLGLAILTLALGFFFTFELATLGLALVCFRGFVAVYKCCFYFNLLSFVSYIFTLGLAFLSI